MKQFKGKAIYNPAGKAAGYSKWACNFYVGCSNGCTYCYCRKGILSSRMGGDKPTLKKCFKDETQALEVFEKELKSNLTELQKHGLFFSFTTDPLIEDTWSTTYMAVCKCMDYNIPVKILTKYKKYIRRFLYNPLRADKFEKMVSIGFTLTGHDELEPNTSTNEDRIEAMKQLHEAGYKTFASIEPIIDLSDSLKMIYDSRYYCDLYKIGLESGRKYDIPHLWHFINGVINLENLHNFDKIAQNITPAYKVYFKDSLLKAAGINRKDLPANCVDRNYNIFEK